MKNIFFASVLTVLAAFSFTACNEEEGTMPGSDGQPVVTVYSYDVASPYNPDNDVAIRFVANNQVQEAYYLVEKSAEVAAFIEKNGKEAYAQHVIEGNKKVTVNVDTPADLVITDLYGPYTISAVAVNGGSKVLRSVEFVGLEWETIKKGTFYLSDAMPNFIKANNNVDEIKDVELQRCTTISTLYRFPDLFAEGYPIKFTTLPSYTGADGGGNYTFVRVPNQETGLSFGSYGMVSIRDVGYWQGADSWITDNGYESGLYTDYSAFFMFQAYCSGGSLGYNAHHKFIPE